MEPLRVLVCCEARKAEGKGVARALEAEGHLVATVESREQARALLREMSPDVVLLDLVLPESDQAGWSLLKEIGELDDPPATLVVSSKLNRVSDRVRALDMGADDFISTKAFDLEELKARMRAVLRRTQARKAPKTGIHIDDDRKEVIVDDRRVSLSPREYYLLKFLCTDVGRVYSSRDILDALWSESSYASDQDVQKYIYLLRKKIEKDPKNPRIILTVRGFGYRLAS